MIRNNDKLCMEEERGKIKVSREQRWEEKNREEHSIDRPW
jgi:hypothetical protein